MNKRIITLLLAAVLTFAFTVNAFAEETTPGVVLNSDGNIAYENARNSQDGEILLGSDFEGIAPGESKTQEIAITNNYANTVSFYIKEDTLKSMEESVKAAGGAYSIQVKVGNSKENAYTLLDTVAGGYSAELTADTQGLASVDELKNYTYLAQLGKGQSTNLYVTVTIDGEAYDMDYAQAVALLGFNFRAYYQDPAGASRISYYINKDVVTEGTVVPIKGDSAKTGDATSNLLPILAGLLLACGLILLLVANKKRKVAE